MIQKIRKSSEILDEDKNGFINKKKLLTQYKKHFPGTIEKQLKVMNKLLEQEDVYNNGKINYAKFLIMMNLGNKEILEKTLKEVFDYYDINKNWYIEPSDIREIFEDIGISNKEVHQLIDNVDFNQDRKLGFTEFYKIFTSAF